MSSGLEQAFDGLQVHLRLPDLWQQEAVRALRDGEDVIVSAPTGAGKTFIFETLIDEDRKFTSPAQAVFTVPTRALANDKWREWRREGRQVGIATGDLADDLDAPVLVATLETQRERLLAGDGPRLLVIDEYQMIADRRRGLHYELAVALAPPETRLLLLSGSVSNPGRVREWLERLGRSARVVETATRPVPLDEIPLQGLPRTAPRRFRNFWQRLAVGTLLSDYGPLLIFAPHRRSAEKIAGKVAEALPDDDPVRLDDRRLRDACSADLQRLLQKRVAYHHSGLAFAERSAVVEPLAKAGQLRVVVATMGLAAGINFSVRSVFVADTTYRDGPFQREVGPDELLQMFGRAGRRGLDETGYLIAGDRSPRLIDARPLELRRQNELDWPTLLRRMHHAAAAGESPFAAARDLRDRLFSRQTIPLGFRPPEATAQGEAGADPASESTGGDGPLFGLKPVRREILDAAGEWETHRPGREDRAPLSECLAHVRGAYRAAEGDSALVSSLLPKRARLCRLDGRDGSPRRYGLEIAVATEAGDETFSLTKFTRSLAGGKWRDAAYTFAEASSLLPPLLEPVIAPAAFEGFARRGATLYLIGHFRDAELEIYRDSADRPLYRPPERTVDIESETHYTDEGSGEAFEPAPGTAAHAWRRLRLIDDTGAPTRRGLVASLFQGGEGLAVAAALEDAHYPVDEIVSHLANLRAGHRFELDAVPDAERLVDSVGSERLAAACRQAYGPVDFEGYLRLGLPPHYGEGAAELVAHLLEGTLPRLIGRLGQADFGHGDVERAYVEWLSLLRHLRHAPDLDDPRWMELKAAAASESDRRDRRSPLASLPDLPAAVLQRKPRHGLRLSRS